MPVKKYMLDGRKIRSVDDLYDQIQAALSVPDFFGRNLDALWDVLSTDTEGPFEIVWKHASTSQKAMKKDFERILQFFKDLEDDRSDFKLTLEK